MIFMFAGTFEWLLALMYLVNRAHKRGGIFGYTSYLASVTDDGFARAQTWCRNSLFMTGLGELLLGAGIHYLQWDRFFIIWLFLAALAFLTPYLYTESRLKRYLIAHDALPDDYVDPDEALRQRSAQRQRTEGLRDQLRHHR